MSSITQHGMLGRWLWPVAVIAALLAVAAAGPNVAAAASAGQHQREKARAAAQPQPPIDSKTDPAAAAAALDAAGSPSNISWQTGTAPGGCQDAQPPPPPPPAAPAQPPPCVPAQNNTAHYQITDGWGLPAVVGNVLYNCSPTAEAETDYGVSDTFTTTFSLSEKVSLKISVGLPDIASVTDEVSAFSKQTNASAKTVTVTQGQYVDPGSKGWSVVQVQTEMVSGTAYVTDPVRDTVTPVQNIDLSFPGHTVTQAQTTSTGHTVPMTPEEIQTICNANPVNVAAQPGGQVVGRGFTLPRPSTFTLQLCGPTGPCRARKVTGSRPPARIRRAAAQLTRAGHTYGRGTYTRGHTRLRLSRALRPGTYRLTLREPTQQVGRGSQHTSETILSVTVG
jgi:hypothetical protein